MFLFRFAQRPAFRSGLATLMELLSDGTRFLMTLTRSLCAFVARTLVAVLQLERVTCHRHKRDVDPLASQGLQVLLALEIARRSYGPARGNSSAHRLYGEGEHHLGRRANCFRTLVKVGHLCFSADCGQVLEDRGLRFPGCSHGPIPGAVCLLSDGSWQPPHSPLQRGRSSDGRLDAAAVSGSPCG